MLFAQRVSLFKLQNTKHIEKYLKVYIHVTGADRNTWQAFIEFYRNDAHRSLPLIAKNSMSSLRRLSPNNIKGTCWSYFFGSCSVFIISDTERSYSKYQHFLRKSSKRFLLYFKTNISINYIKKYHLMLRLYSPKDETPWNPRLEISGKTKTVNLKNSYFFFLWQTVNKYHGRI